MSLVSHQTVRLSAGKHSSPHEGACVMELASMLAGEQFTDHPACVCPVIGSFLRAYNDSVDDDRRQDLYAYASRVVGSRAATRVQRARADRLAEWSSETFLRRYSRLLPDRIARAVACLHKPPLAIEALGASAAHAIPRHTPETHAAALALIDELLAIGGDDKPAPAPAPAAEPTPPAEVVSTA
jgi:hypothetical protein